MFSCDGCRYYTNIKYNYNLHLKTKKHLVNIIGKCESQCGKYTSNVTEINNKTLLENKETIEKKKDNEKHSEKEKNKKNCDICGKNYSCKQSLYLYLHKKKCKEIPNNIKNSIINNTTNNINNINNITNNINNKFIINNYSNTDLSFLNDDIFINAIKGVNYSVINFIKDIHFNNEKRENMNIQLNNIRGNLLNVYENGKWLAKFNEIDNMYEKYESFIDEWNDNEGDKYPITREKYLRYLKNKPEIFKKLKQETIEMLYNNTLIHFNKT
jgi:hypothetical protein